MIQYSNLSSVMKPQDHFKNGESLIISGSILRKIVLVLLTVVFVFVGCDKGNNQETSNEELCLYLNSENLDKTIPIINDYLAGLKGNLNDEQKLQEFTKWLKSHSCVIDATILCVSCIETFPAQSEISVSFKENEITVIAVFDILMSNPLKAVRICSINFVE